MHKLTSAQLLHLALWVVFAAAIALDWTGHMDQHAENIVEAMMFMLGGGHIATFFAGKVSNAADLIARLKKIEESIESDDGSTPGIAQSAPANISSITPKS